MKPNYKIHKLKIEFQEGRAAAWRFGQKTVKGTEHLYLAKDENFSSLNKWILAVRVPHNVYGDIVLQPISVPAKKVWAGIDRRSVVFTRATKQGFKSHVYCKVNLADPTGDHNKLGTRRGDRSALPNWFEPFFWRMRLKQTVTTTRGRDGKAQVVIMKRHDYPTMLKLYFALKVWVLEEGFSIDRN